MRYTNILNTEGLADTLRSEKERAKSSAQSGAYAAAATKRYRTTMYLDFVLGMEKEFNLDVTPHLAMRICKELWGISPSVAILEDLWQQEGRTAHSSTPNIESCIDTVKADADKLALMVRNSIEAAKTLARC